MLTVLFAAPAYHQVMGVVADADIWWHLRTGEWISQHNALPRVDLFSAQNAGKPWAAYSWLYELLTFRLFQRLGLIGIVGYTAGMVLAITVALRHLVKRLQSDQSIVALLTFGTLFCLSHVLTPRPWLFSILFFVLEIDILMQARKTGKLAELAWLPVIFALWSNTHIQFIDGLAVMGLALMEALVAERGLGGGSGAWIAALPPRKCCWRPLAMPFGWHIYRVAYDLASQPGVINQISELQALEFRDVNDFLLLFLGLAAAAALGWAKRVRMFEAGLLIFAAVVSFRSRRDIWILSIVAAGRAPKKRSGGKRRR